MTVRKWFPGWKFEVFNVFFVVCYQQMLLLAFVSPAAAVMQAEATNDAPMNTLDAIATLLFAILLIGETVADAQMYAFQTEKYRRIKAEEPLGEYSRGFIETGLYAYSRSVRFDRKLDQNFDPKFGL